MWCLLELPLEERRRREEAIEESSSYHVNGSLMRSVLKLAIL
jgi:hypothetical protein